MIMISVLFLLGTCLCTAKANIGFGMSMNQPINMMPPGMNVPNSFGPSFAHSSFNQNFGQVGFQQLGQSPRLSQSPVSSYGQVGFQQSPIVQQQAGYPQQQPQQVIQQSAPPSYGQVGFQQSPPPLQQQQAYGQVGFQHHQQIMQSQAPQAYGQVGYQQQPQPVIQQSQPTQAYGQVGYQQVVPQQQQQQQQQQPNVGYQSYEQHVEQQQQVDQQQPGYQPKYEQEQQHLEQQPDQPYDQQITVTQGDLSGPIEPYQTMETLSKEAIQLNLDTITSHGQAPVRQQQDQQQYSSSYSNSNEQNVMLTLKVRKPVKLSCEQKPCHQGERCVPKPETLEGYECVRERITVVQNENLRIEKIKKDEAFKAETMARCKAAHGTAHQRFDIFGHPTLFVECFDNGDSDIRTCPEPLVFNKFLDRCDDDQEPLSSGCASSPCQFGAACHELSNLDYRCECPTGFSGKNCQQVPDVCAVAPCGNADGNVCHVLPPESGLAYFCTCFSGKAYGLSCEADKVEKNPCEEDDIQVGSVFSTRIGTSVFGLCDQERRFNLRVCDRQMQAQGKCKWLSQLQGTSVVEQHQQQQQQQQQLPQQQQQLPEQQQQQLPQQPQQQQQQQLPQQQQQQQQQLPQQQLPEQQQLSSRRRRGTAKHHQRQRHTVKKHM